MTEPYTDVPAIAVAVVGILVFGYMVIMAYSAYAEGAYYASVKDDIRTIATSVASDGAIAVDGMPGVLDARKMTIAEKTGLDMNYGYGNSMVYITIECTPGNMDDPSASGTYNWHFGKPTSGGHSVYYSMPVTVRLNEARSNPGTMTVIITEA